MSVTKSQDTLYNIVLYDKFVMRITLTQNAVGCPGYLIRGRLHQTEENQVKT